MNGFRDVEPRGFYFLQNTKEFDEAKCIVVMADVSATSYQQAGPGKSKLAPKKLVFNMILFGNF